MLKPKIYRHVSIELFECMRLADDMSNVRAFCRWAKSATGGGAFRAARKDPDRVILENGPSVLPGSWLVLDSVSLRVVGDETFEQEYKPNAD